MSRLAPVGLPSNWPLPNGLLHRKTMPQAITQKAVHRQRKRLGNTR